MTLNFLKFHEIFILSHLFPDHGRGRGEEVGM